MFGGRKWNTDSVNAGGGSNTDSHSQVYRLTSNATMVTSNGKGKSKNTVAPSTKVSPKSGSILLLCAELFLYLLAFVLLSNTLGEEVSNL